MTRLGWSLDPRCNWFMSMQIHVHVYVNTHIYNAMLSICPQGTYPYSDTTKCNPLTRKPPCSSRVLESRIYYMYKHWYRPLIVAVHIFFSLSCGVRKRYAKTLRQSIQPYIHIIENSTEFPLFIHNHIEPVTLSYNIIFYLNTSHTYTRASCSVLILSILHTHALS